MILDNELILSEAQAITATANSANIYDLDVAGRDIGVGEQLYVVSTVTTAFTDSGSDSTVAVSLVTDDNTSLSSPATLQSLYSFAALSAVGTTRIARINPENAELFQRYLGVTYTVSGGNLTTGAITTYITHDIQKWKAYASVSGFE